jgi:hypothetical protein
MAMAMVLFATQEQSPMPLRTKRSSSFDPSSAGVGGVLRLVDTSKKQVDESLEEAFKDLRALMEKAQEMVALAERLRRSVANSSNDVPSSGSRDTWTHVMEDLTRLGIGSPVSRDLIESESRYYVELARQVYDFALKHIAKESAHLTTASSTTPVRMPVTLVDLYCLYNRARGTNLISPDDLLRACQLFVTLGLKDLKLEKLPSGVLALVPQQAATDSTMDITRLLATHITQHGPATALQVANALRLSIPLVTHYLLVSLFTSLSPCRLHLLPVTCAVEFRLTFHCNDVAFTFSASRGCRTPLSRRINGGTYFLAQCFSEEIMSRVAVRFSCQMTHSLMHGVETYLNTSVAAMKCATAPIQEEETRGEILGCNGVPV